MRILLVDDSLLARRLIVNYLKSFGFNDIIEAVDGLDALRKLNKTGEKIDIIITDWLMPNMDGLNFITELKKEEKFHDIPILMVTALNEKEDVIKAFHRGVNGYISKPIEMDIFKKKVDELLGKSNDYLLNK